MSLFNWRVGTLSVVSDISSLLLKLHDFLEIIYFIHFQRISCGPVCEQAVLHIQ